ncbi:MAG TPA: DUF1186 domain-containing protein [Rhodopila sp.]|nr:DUF1186 domain-containing protein [Rhodopila sp.]
MAEDTHEIATAAEDALSVAVILDAFADDSHILPEQALRQAMARWDEVGDTLLDSIRAFGPGRDRSDRDKNIALMAIYIAASLRDTRAFPLVCALDDGRDSLDEILGDGVTEDLPEIFCRLYDGTLDTLKAVIENEAGNEMVRNSALSALAWLTHTGAIGREETQTYLGTLHGTLRPRKSSWLWYSWTETIAKLGMTELTPLVEDIYAKGWTGEVSDNIADFHKDLRAAQAAKDGDNFFSHEKDDGRLDDIVSFMSEWEWYKPRKSWASDKGASSLDPFTWLPRDTMEPYRNPNRGVGRNDPCPCGSGKKYKKCCLNAVE